MKLSLALGPRKPLSRQMAAGCLSTNLAFPGFGSLLAGRRVGYLQVPFTILGLGMTMICGIPALIWGFRNFARIQQNEDDPFAALSEMMAHFRWALLGIAVFGFGLLWALLTSLSILAEARAAERTALLNQTAPPSAPAATKPIPPKLKPPARD